MDPNQNQESQQTPKQQVVERVRDATNVLVTVRSSPTVDELAATIGLTLMLNKLGKHATAVFSGAVPSTLEFLKPDETLEANTDSLRDFIVSLDKSKADKLRYKVEENVVKIFITPYRTSISEKDLEFTQGDFNVDVVLALGVTQREELDQAITSHGRILHDATVVTVTAGQRDSQLGAINWQDAAASSLSEMLVSVSEAFQGGIIDEQMATAFLTGIVAETERFSNTKTSPKVMTMAAQLMAAGANQQLIANELDKVQELPQDVPASVPHEEEAAPVAAASDDGSLTIDHAESDSEPEVPKEESPQPAAPDFKAEEATSDKTASFLPPLPTDEGANSFEPLLTTDVQAEPAPEAPKPEEPAQDMFAPLDVIAPQEGQPQDDNQIHIDEHGNILKPDRPLSPHHKVIEPLGNPEPNTPGMDAQLAELSNLLKENSQSGLEDAHITDVKGTSSADPLPEAAATPELDLPSLPPAPEMVEPTPAPAPEPQPAPQPSPEPESTHPQMPEPDTTLLDIEKSVHSPHVELTGDNVVDDAAHVDSARNAVQEAITLAGFDPNRPEPRADAGAPMLGVPSHDQPAPVMNGFDPSVPQPVAENNDNQSPPPPPIPPPMMPGSFPPQ